MDDYPANENADAQGHEDDIIPLSRVEELGRSIYDLRVVGLDGTVEPVLDPVFRGKSDRTTPEMHVQRKRTIVDVLKVLEVAGKRGVSKQVSVETLLAVSISMFVELIGRDRAANLFSKIPDKIRGGDFG